MKVRMLLTITISMLSSIVLVLNLKNYAEVNPPRANKNAE